MITVVAGILFNHEGRFLIARKKAGKTLAGYWEFPGGKLEVNEAPAAALIREIREEFLAEATQPRPYLEYDFSYPETDIHFIFFTAFLQDTEILTMSDHDQVAWIRPGDLINYRLAPGDVEASLYILKNGF